MMRIPYFLTFFALINFLFIGCNDDIPLVIELVSPDELKSGAQVADGKTPYLFTAKVDPQVSGDYKMITFRCSDGEFLGEGDKKSRTVMVNNSGIAEINWIVPKQGGKYFVSVSTGKEPNIYKDEEEIILKNETKQEIKINLQLSDSTAIDNLRADNESVVSLKMTIANSPTNSITLSSNAGVLSDGSTVERSSVVLKANQEGVANASIKVTSQVLKYIIKATITGRDTIFSTLSFTPKRAWPNYIIIEPSNVNPTLGTSIGLSIFLKRNLGKVSIGTPIKSIEAYQEVMGVKKNVGRFIGLTNALTSIDENINLTFFTDTGDFDKDLNIPVSILVKSQDDKGALVPGDMRLWLKDK